MSREEAFREAAGVAIGLLRSPEVAARWGEPSALAQMSIGALAQHLGSQVLLARAAAHDPAYAGDGEPVATVEHYRRAAWVGADIDAGPNVAVRQGAERASEAGPDAVLHEVEAALADLSPWPADAPGTVRMPWWEWCLTRDDFLVTRMMELMVHADDLAVSLGVGTPEFPAEVAGPVLALLTAVAEDQHGQAAVVRALTRRERAPESIVVF